MGDLGRIQRGVPESIFGKRLVPSAEPIINQVVVAEGGSISKPYGSELVMSHRTNPTAALDEIKGVINAVTTLDTRAPLLSNVDLDRLRLNVDTFLRIATEVATPYLRWVIGISTRYFSQEQGSIWGRFNSPAVRAYLQLPSRVLQPISIMTKWSEFIREEDRETMLQATTVALTVDMRTQPLNSVVSITIQFPSWMYLHDQLNVIGDYAINATYSMRPVLIAAWKPDE